MKIGVVSDTHRNVALLEKAVDWLVARQKIAALYHLGDDYNDVDVLAERYLDIIQVPGIYDERYRSGELAAIRYEAIFGIQILLVHAIDKDASDEDISRSDIICHGHTHKAELKLLEGKLYMNPGHLKGPLDKNMPPTFGLLSIADRGVTASIYNMDFRAVSTIELQKSESGFYKS